MPIFEYRCSTCNLQFEALVRGSDAPTCPKCEGHDLVKQLSTFAVGAPSLGARALSQAPCGTCGDPRGPGSCAMN